MNDFARELEKFFHQLKEVEQIDAISPGVTYQEIRSHWQKFHLPEGSIILLALPNSALLLKHFFALYTIGLVPVMTSPSFPSQRLEELIEVFQARAIVKTMLVPMNIKFSKTTSFSGTEIGIVSGHRENLANAGEVILTTSGTSGISSGCVFDFASNLLNAKKHAEVIGMTEKDVVLVNLPLFYSYAFVAQALAALQTGARLIISGPPFNKATYCQNIMDYAVTISSLTPLLAEKLIDNEISLPDTLRVLTVGGDSIAAKYITQFLQRYPDKEFYITYGITQAGPRVATLAAHKALENELTSVGIPLPGVEVYLDEQKGEKGVGELLIRSHTSMKRRIGRLESVSQQEFTKDGFFRSGDLFYQDLRGNLFFRGRISDSVNIAGEKICLSSIKRIINTLPNVCDSKIHLLNEGNRHIGYELIVLFHHEIQSNSDLMQQIRKLLPRYQWPNKLIVELVNKQDLNRYK